MGEHLGAQLVTWRSSPLYMHYGSAGRSGHHWKDLACPWGVSTLRLPLASWSFSMASKRDLKFPAPKPWKDSKEERTASFFSLLPEDNCCEIRSELTLQSMNDKVIHLSFIIVDVWDQNLKLFRKVLTDIMKLNQNQKVKKNQKREPFLKILKIEKRDEWLWEFFRSAPGSASNFHVVKGWRLTTRLFWQEGSGYRWSATGHNLIQRSPSLWSLLICICDRFTGLFQVGDFYNVQAGWELRTGVPALLLS